MCFFRFNDSIYRSMPPVVLEFERSIFILEEKLSLIFYLQHNVHGLLIVVN
jgi:hypothetical protein